MCLQLSWTVSRSSWCLLSLERLGVKRINNNNFANIWMTFVDALTSFCKLLLHFKAYFHTMALPHQHAVTTVLEANKQKGLCRWYGMKMIRSEDCCSLLYQETGLQWSSHQPSACYCLQSTTLIVSLPLLAPSLHLIVKRLKQRPFSVVEKNKDFEKAVCVGLVWTVCVCCWNNHMLGLCALGLVMG